jgi:hypothetical protein
MAQPQKFIKLANGRLTEELVESLAQTTGASDADKLVRTGTDGKLDQSLMPAGMGADVLTVTASEALSAGDFVNIHTGGVRKADAAAAGKEADGFVLDAVSSGQPATVYFEGRNTGLTELTVGARYYLSAATAGAVVTTPPAATGNVVQFLGRASEATSIAFEATDGVILA